MSEETVIIKSLGRRYGEDTDEAAVWAIRQVTFSLHAGEVTVLMGPSGSGKTTLLSVIGCVLAPTEGQLSVCGQALEQFNESQRQLFRRKYVGFIFQTYNLLSSLTALENVQVALTLRGSSEEQGMDWLERVGLADKADSFPVHLSGGQRQRVAVARALVGDPPVLLADEPTAALDAFQGRRVMDLLRGRAHRSGTTVLVVTHDPRVREFADRVVELEDGRVNRIIRRLRKPGSAPSIDQPVGAETGANESP